MLKSVLIVGASGAVVVAALGLTANRRAGVPGTADRVPVVVELFTSEGCSSCPPADAVLMDLVARQPVAGAQVIALSEHVDYWDRQGWRDPFSNHSFTQRQSAYAAASGTAEVYTPQMVVDGNDSFVGSDRAAALRAIARAAAQAKPQVLLTASSELPRVLTINIAANPATVTAPVWFAIVEDGLSSAVTGGENSGRALQHAAVTRRFTSLGKTEKDGAFRRETPLDLDPRWNPRALRAVVIVQPAAVGRIAAAGAIALGGSAPRP